MELNDDRLSLSRIPSALDEAVLEFTEILSATGVEYVVVSGYVVILTGRSRATEDVDIVLEPLTEGQVEELIAALSEHGYWGMAMPFDEMYAMLSGGDRFRIAEEGELYPNFEVWFASNDVERTSLEGALTAELDGHELQISPLELQLAYKLRLAQLSGSLDGKDFEDALHLYLTFGERLKTETLERFVDAFGVEEYYAELERL